MIDVVEIHDEGRRIVLEEKRHPLAPPSLWFAVRGPGARYTDDATGCFVGSDVQQLIDDAVAGRS